jgi:hypothetical protein
MIPRSTTLGPSAVILGALAWGMEIDETVPGVWDKVERM